MDGLEVSSRAGGGPGGERFWSCTQFRIGGRDGKAAGVAHAMREITGRVRNQRRLALADEAGARIGTTLDTTRTGRPAWRSPASFPWRSMGADLHGLLPQR